MSFSTFTEHQEVKVCITVYYGSDTMLTSSVVTDASTGQLNPNPSFYNSYNYERAYKFLGKKLHEIDQEHTDAIFQFRMDHGKSAQKCRLLDSRHD